MANKALPCPPWKIEARAMYCAAAPEETTAILSHNNVSKTIRSQMSFISSTGSSSGGGVCSNDTSLSGSLRRYFSDKLVDDSQDLFTHSCGCLELSWVGHRLGITSVHREMRRKGSSTVSCPTPSGDKRFRSYVRDEDHPLLVENALSGLRAVFERTKTFNGLLVQLENLGHKPAPRTEGLNVELFEFQRQAIGWALERENAPGGMQSYFWIKIPTMSPGKQSGAMRDIYFNPVLDSFSFAPPRMARGGFICEQVRVCVWVLVYLCRREGVNVCRIAHRGRPGSNVSQE